ncbi:hypothetical protein HT886_003939 [Salmonella enterica]|uniref:Uncharacterized protein n=2 Tax=Salmonella enterica I TaxID=59201 RepID=A0A719CZ39_SALTS|nr:hypothetical protein [Salmonella enterica]EBG3528014.1 hypothetical protein [Salmonella enterica subsp. enterica]EBR8224008.1 hypothetical protein [Salmonella enterica subsp. enterica serovar Oranienburg]EBS1478584.1 hypothetical protein [Salmonella enterica subsp. enterica serovar Saintpaul]EBU7005561.1 hypothetical protein [Salmonella enterica subsp. enterica serovar Kintambo]EBV8441057.1 hypothetical protein [Salmonella enterica subsp. enterica serovar Chester]EBV9368675.1 hypothetical 
MDKLREKQTENLLMYPGMALMCAAVAYFFLAGQITLPDSLAKDVHYHALWQLELVRETLVLFVSGATLSLGGWGLSLFNAWRRWSLMTQQCGKEQKR